MSGRRLTMIGDDPRLVDAGKDRVSGTTAVKLQLPQSVVRDAIEVLQQAYPELEGVDAETLELNTYGRAAELAAVALGSLLLKAGESSVGN